MTATTEQRAHTLIHHRPARRTRESCPLFLSPSPEKLLSSYLPLSRQDVGRM